ncbi:MAG: exonuclease domain-containing protein [Eggerthellales bacterium]|nr:exonuclease domain-containing protein [Eggerthellales bacterium]
MPTGWRRHRIGTDLRFRAGPHRSTKTPLHQLSRHYRIRTCDVSDAPSFAEALASFAAWIGESSTRIVAWSKNDRAQIESECAFKGIEVPRQLRRWLDLQVVYPRVLGVGDGRKMRLSTAADWYGAEVDSDKAHRALYDARVTAELMRQIMTGSFMDQKRALESAMKPASNPLSSKLGDACSSLAALKASLLAAEAQFAA